MVRLNKSFSIHRAMVLTSFTVKIRSFDGSNATKEFNIGLIIEVSITMALNPLQASQIKTNISRILDRFDKIFLNYFLSFYICFIGLLLILVSL